MLELLTLASLDAESGNRGRIRWIRLFCCAYVVVLTIEGEKNGEACKCALVVSRFVIEAVSVPRGLMRA
jgi:hypothetical protein